MPRIRLSRSVVLVALIGLACQHERATAPGVGPKAEAAPPLDPHDFIAAHHNAAPSNVRPSFDTRPAPQADTSGFKPRVEDFMITVAVVMMPRLPIADASAVVLRRPQPWPQHVIMLRQDSLSTGALGSAMHALSVEVQKANTDQPTSLQVIKVKGQALPELWKKVDFYRNLAQWELDTLRQLPPRMVAGVGAHPAMLIGMGVQRTTPPGQSRP